MCLQMWGVSSLFSKWRGSRPLLLHIYSHFYISSYVTINTTSNQLYTIIISLIKLTGWYFGSFNSIYMNWIWILYPLMFTLKLLTTFLWGMLCHTSIRSYIWCCVLRLCPQRRAWLFITVGCQQHHFFIRCCNFGHPTCPYLCEC